MALLSRMPYHRVRRIQLNWKARKDARQSEEDRTTNGRTQGGCPIRCQLMPALIKRLQAESIATSNETCQTVSDVSYAGDEGGIVCHIVPPDRREALVVSLTHLRVSRTMPLASAVVDYQKHRVKKLKKQSYS